MLYWLTASLMTLADVWVGGHLFVAPNYARISRTVGDGTMESTNDVWKQFGENSLTHSQAHHLLAILELTQTKGYARVTDVARFLEITTGSASTNLKGLKQKRLVIEDENRFISLGPEGRNLAEAILDRRSVLMSFFEKVLGVDHKQAEIDACKTEHLLSIETTSKMAAWAGREG
jgi:DtxR family transcriptional regulator, Mn-dependent transcriptional regulator